MTSEERKKLEAKRADLENARAVGMARINQAIGAISMIDTLLAEADAADLPAKSNGAEHQLDA